MYEKLFRRLDAAIDEDAQRPTGIPGKVPLTARLPPRTVYLRAEAERGPAQRANDDRPAVAGWSPGPSVHAFGLHLLSDGIALSLPVRRAAAAGGGLDASAGDKVVAAADRITD